MTYYLPLFFAAPFAIMGFIISAWFIYEVCTAPIVDPYDDESNWGN